MPRQVVGIDRHLAGQTEAGRQPPGLRRSDHNTVLLEHLGPQLDDRYMGMAGMPPRFIAVLVMGRMLFVLPMLVLTMLGMGGALGAPATAYMYDWNMLPIGQQLWLKQLESSLEELTIAIFGFCMSASVRPSARH